MEMLTISLIHILLILVTLLAITVITSTIRVRKNKNDPYKDPDDYVNL